MPTSLRTAPVMCYFRAMIPCRAVGLLFVLHFQIQKAACWVHRLLASIPSKLTFISRSFLHLTLTYDSAWWIGRRLQSPCLCDGQCLFNFLSMLCTLSLATWVVLHTFRLDRTLSSLGWSLRRSKCFRGTQWGGLTRLILCLFAGTRPCAQTCRWGSWGSSRRQSSIFLWRRDRCRILIVCCTSILARHLSHLSELARF